VSKKWKSKKYLIWIASNKCLLCHYHECQAHHITIAEKRGISQKVSDKFTIPLCYPHHQQLHNFGERKYWEKLDIDPVYQANVFYNMWEKDRIYDEMMLNELIYDKLLPKCQNNIDFLMQVK